MSRCISMCAAALLLLAELSGLHARAEAQEHRAYDAVVVGAGPAGIVAAMNTLQQLRQTAPATGPEPRVLLIEKRGDLASGATLRDARATDGTAFSREQVIGVKPSVLRELRSLGFELPERFRATHVRAVQTPGAVRNASPERQRGPAQALYNEGSTHVLALNQLQHMLANHARQMGVEFRFGAEVHAIEGGRDTARVRMRARGESQSLGSVRARWVIGADGAGGATSRMVGLEPTNVQRQGVMVGAWFKGVPQRTQLIYGEGVVPGRTSVMLGSGRLQYGLFALPPNLARLIRNARETGRPLDNASSLRIRQHVEGQARHMLSSSQSAGSTAPRMTRMQPFEVALNRTPRSVSLRHRTVLVGDANRTVNPLTGLGANISMFEAMRASRAVVQAIRTRQPNALRRYNRTSSLVTGNIHRASAELQAAFRRPALRVRTPEGSPLGRARLGVRNPTPRFRSRPRPRARFR